MAASSDDTNLTAPRSIRVWDLPTRLFHWALVLLVCASIYTGNVGGLWQMDLHMLAGFTILALIVFRLTWGFVGSTHSRFADFVHGPGAALAYVRELGSRHIPSVGHNPLGGWSVLAMLASLLVQAVTGLYAHDDIFTEGPLAKTVSKQTGNLMTVIHEINATVLYVLIGTHLVAVFGYLLVKRENLIRPMITGRKATVAGAADAAWASPWLALAIVAVASAAVWWVVTG